MRCLVMRSSASMIVRRDPIVTLSPLWGGELSFLPHRGRGTMRSMVEGHVRCFLSFIRNATPPVPPHPLRGSPSPFRGGSAPSRRLQTLFTHAFIPLPFHTYTRSDQKHGRAGQVFGECVDINELCE